MQGGTVGLERSIRPVPLVLRFVHSPLKAKFHIRLFDLVIHADHVQEGLMCRIRLENDPSSPLQATLSKLDHRPRLEGAAHRNRYGWPGNISRRVPIHRVANDARLLSRDGHRDFSFPDEADIAILVGAREREASAVTKDTALEPGHTCRAPCPIVVPDGHLYGLDQLGVAQAKCP